MVVPMASDISEVEIGEQLDLLDEELQGTTDCDTIKTIIKSNNNILSVLHLNIRSIHKNFNNLLIFLEAYDFKNCDIMY